MSIAQKQHINNPLDTVPLESQVAAKLVGLTQSSEDLPGTQILPLEYEVNILLATFCHLISISNWVHARDLRNPNSILQAHLRYPCRKYLQDTPRVLGPAT